jgi:hypothetical protein
MAELSARMPAATQTFCDMCGDQGGDNGSELYFLHFLGIYIKFVLS